MTYVSKKEKVFDLPEQEDASSVSLKATETHLKRFPSVSDRRAWTNEDHQRYQHLYSLVNGSESSVNKSSSSFKYIPFDVLLGILMAEKDAYIQELLERQDTKSSLEGKLYKAEGFEDSDDDRDALIRKDAEMVALKNKIAGLETELQDYRDTLTKAMHKLEKMDKVMSENNLLNEKLNYLNETLKRLEEEKRDLENELSYYKKSSNCESNGDKNGNHQWKKEKSFFSRGGHLEEIKQLSSERDILKFQVEELQKELERVKVSAAEVEVLRKMSETKSCSLEEITKENKCYKKKLEAMKYLEKHIEELKKQAHTLADKYKRESQKANDQLKQINMNAKELENLREERDRLQRRVDELTSYESQSLSLQSKLRQVEMILDENEMLNKKLLQLDKLELENEHLKMKIDELQSAEIQAAADKEKILQLQYEIVDQEEEMRKMLRQIEELSEGYSDKNEIYRLRNELNEKKDKLKQYEMQITEIPFLESEIEELKNKLQKCVDDYKIDKDSLRRLQEELEACRNRCQELEEEASRSSADLNDCQSEQNVKVEASNFGTQCDIVKASECQSEEVNSSSVVLEYRDAQCQSCVVESAEKVVEVRLDGVSTGEPLDELNALKERNRALKAEVETLRSKMSDINLDEFLMQIGRMKELVNLKEERILQLESEVLQLQDELKRHYDEFDADKNRRSREEMEEEIAYLKMVNEKLMVEVETRQEAMKQVRELEISLSREKKARDFAMNLVKDLEREIESEFLNKERTATIDKLRKEEANVARQEVYRNLSSEISELKFHKSLLEKIIRELKKENKILRQLKEFAEKVEIAGQKQLIGHLRSQVKALKSLSKPELQAEYESVQEKVRLLLKETDTLVSEINSLKVALDAEKKNKDFLEKELVGLQVEIAACLTAGTRVFDKELAARDVLEEELKNQLANARREMDEASTEMRTLKEENVRLLNCCDALRSEQKNLESEINRLTSQIAEQKNLVNEINRLSEEANKESKPNVAENVSSSGEEQSMATPNENETGKILCESEEHKNLDEKFLMLSARAEEQRITIMNQERKETEFITEIENLKSKIELHESEIIKLKAVEEDLRVKLGEVTGALLSKDDRNQGFQDKDQERRGWASNSDASKLFKECYAEEYFSKRVDLEKETLALGEALEETKNDFEDLRIKSQEKASAYTSLRDSLLNKLNSFEHQAERLKRELEELEKLEKEPRTCKDSVSLKCSNDKTKTVEELISELEDKRVEIRNLKTENENLKNELSKAEGMLEISKKLHKSAAEICAVPPSMEFFTPPALPSPKASDLEPEGDPTATIPVDAHRKELTNLENHFRREIQKLKEANSKKIKKLTVHNEKDTKCRIKAFHESINNIKSNYESGIRKLVEKHKTSIAKLQELHEEEVEELNKNYETQMDAMEKQNENLISDMKAKSAEKCKRMAETHNRELQEVEAKYEKLLKEKEAQVQAERAKIESESGESQKLQKRAVDHLAQFYQNAISELEEKHNKDLRKCKKVHMKKAELMRNKYEDLLREERKKYEEQLEDLLHQLKKGQGKSSDRVSMNFVPGDRDRRTSANTAGLQFIEVLQKILNEGLESLTFEELLLVHSKTCFMPESASDRKGERGGGELNELTSNECKHGSLMAAEKEELLKRIFTLEREIVIKQLETHEAIINMEAAEKCRIQELKSALCEAQQKNSELERHLSNQSKYRLDMQIEKYMMDRQALLNETTVREKVKELEREKAERKRIEDELEREKMNLKNVTAILESEKERFKSQRKRDADYVESIRLRLEEALNHEQMMESQLDSEAKFRAKLEFELQSLQKSFTAINDETFAADFNDGKATKITEEVKNSDRCGAAAKEKMPIRCKSRNKSLTKGPANL